MDTKASQRNEKDKTKKEGPEKRESLRSVDGDCGGERDAQVYLQEIAIDSL